MSVANINEYMNKAVEPIQLGGERRDYPLEFRTWTADGGHAHGARQAAPISGSGMSIVQYVFELMAGILEPYRRLCL